MCVYKQANSKNLKLLFLTIVWLIGSFLSNVPMDTSVYLQLNPWENLVFDE